MQRLANALVHLKRVFPGANAALLVARQPALACHTDLASLDAAGQELREMLPGVDVDRCARKPFEVCKTACGCRHHSSNVFG